MQYGHLRFVLGRNITARLGYDFEVANNSIVYQRIGSEIVEGLSGNETVDLCDRTFDIQQSFAHAPLAHQNIRMASASILVR